MSQCAILTLSPRHAGVDPAYRPHQIRARPAPRDRRLASIAPARWAVSRTKTASAVSWPLGKSPLHSGGRTFGQVHVACAQAFLQFTKSVEAETVELLWRSRLQRPSRARRRREGRSRREQPAWRVRYEVASCTRCWPSHSQWWKALPLFVARASHPMTRARSPSTMTRRLTASALQLTATCGPAHRISKALASDDAGIRLTRDYGQFPLSAKNLRRVAGKTPSGQAVLSVPGPTVFDMTTPGNHVVRDYQAQRLDLLQQGLCTRPKCVLRSARRADAQGKIPSVVDYLAADPGQVDTTAQPPHEGYLIDNGQLYH
jgi:hypothetical protein